MSHKVFMLNKRDGTMKAATLNQMSLQPYIDGILRDWKISGMVTTHYGGMEKIAGILCNRTDFKMGKNPVVQIWIESK